MRVYGKFILKILIISSLLLAIDSLILERYVVRFPEYEFVSKQVLKDFDGYRIAIISDLQLGLLDPEIWIQWVIQETNEKNPDLIVGLGDSVKKNLFAIEVKPSTMKTHKSLSPGQETYGRMR